MTQKKIKIFCPIFQQFEFMLYCSSIFNFNEVIFENSITDKSIFLQENIVDVKLIKDFHKININNKKKYQIFFWNGEKHYFENFDIIKKIKKRLKKNLSFFFVGNATKITNVQLANKIREKQVSFKNISLRNKIAFFYPYLFSVVSAIKDFKKFIKLSQKEMICFTGLVNINTKFIKHLKDDWHFSNSSILILKKFRNFLNKKENTFLIDIIKLYFNSKDYSKLPIYEKYFMSQIIFRNLLFKLLINNKIFFLQDWNDRSKLMDSMFYKKLLFLDLGSTAGSETIYARHLILKHFKKKSIKINFFKKENKKNFTKSNQKMIKYIEHLISLKNLNNFSFSKLKKELIRFKSFS